jgi:hypothetical protein
MREGALKGSFRMQREIKRAHHFVRSSYTRMSNNTSTRARNRLFTSAIHTYGVSPVALGLCPCASALKLLTFLTAQPSFGNILRSHDRLPR